MCRNGKRFRRVTSLVMIPALAVKMMFLNGCGAGDDTYTYEEDVYDEVDEDFEYEDEGSRSEVFDEDSSEEYFDEGDVIERIKNRQVTYQIDNDILYLEAVDDAPVQITIENFCDEYAIEYAKEKDCEEFLLWLSDYVVNCVEPQAVEMLLQIPVLREAADNGQLSKYISIYLTYNDVNQFGAMEETCYLGRDGHGIEDWDSPMYYVGHKILINLASFDPDTAEDNERLCFLQSSMIHELMHAFVTDYLTNLSIGIGRDGARVLERDSNGKIVMDENDQPISPDVIPGWLQEGIAETVENGYGTRRDDLLYYFSGLASDEDYLEVLSSPEIVAGCLNLDAEELGTVNVASLKDEGNTYSTGYIATLALCAMAAQKLGYDAFDEDGTLLSDVLLYGLNDILKRIHDGSSLDYVIADISFDNDLGKSVYADTKDFEEKCFGDMNDLGLIFLQGMLFDYEARRQNNPGGYTPCGSVLPGYVNGEQLCMDENYHKQAPVYAVENIDAGNPGGDYFCISTIRMSQVALTGGKSTSYDQLLNPLSKAEEAERDHCYIGDELRFIDISLEDD